MTSIQFLNEKGSSACKMLIKETGITRYRKGSVPDLLINYGLAGEKQNKFFTKYAKAKNVPTINARCGVNKYKAVKLVKDFGLLAPESKSSLSRTDSLTDWLEKKYNSHCGIGICIAKQKESLKSKYYQKFIKDRVFELRVHAFSWMPEKEWTVLKRLGDKNTIAWNFSQGGHFSTARSSISAIAEEARKLSTSILKILHLEFGAIDFIVDNKKNIFFIEINTQPGMTGLSDAIYIKAFNKLKGMTKENIIKQFNHIT